MLAITIPRRSSSPLTSQHSFVFHSLGSLFFRIAALQLFGYLSLVSHFAFSLHPSRVEYVAVAALTQPWSASDHTLTMTGYSHHTISILVTCPIQRLIDPSLSTLC
jgi:hypothetical protein